MEENRLKEIDGYFKKFVGRVLTLAESSSMSSLSTRLEKFKRALENQIYEVRNEYIEVVYDSESDVKSGKMIETLDNEQYDLDKPIGISIEDKVAIEKIDTIEKLKQFYQDNKGRNAGILKEFNKCISDRKVELEKIEPIQAEEAEQLNKDDSIRQPGDEE